MEQLKLAQFENTGNASKASEILKEIDISYCIPDTHPIWPGYTPLHFAVKERVLDVTNELLEQGADLFKQGTEDGYTPLHVVINATFNRSRFIQDCKDYKNEELQDLRLSNILLSKQVNINNAGNPKNKHGVSHLHIACIVNHAEAVELFAKVKVPLDLPINHVLNCDPDDYRGMIHLQGFTPLHCAVKYSSVKAADILLQYGADIYVKNADGLSSVHLLIKRIMLMTDFITMGKRTLCTIWVEEMQRIECIIKLVLEKRASDHVFLDETGLSALHLACTLGDKSIVEELLKQKVDVNMRIKNESKFWPSWTPLHFAACFNIDTMILLMESGADISIENSKGETALDLCAKRFTPADVQRILSAKKEYKEIVLSDNSTKLSDLLLAMNNCIEFKDFLQNLEDVNLTVPIRSPIWPGYNLLHLCVSLNEKTIDRQNEIWLELPEAIEADVERYNCTDEEEALYWNRIKMCLEYGCSVSMQNAKGDTPIHLAFKMLKEQTTRKLLECSECNVIDKNRLSHLHIACAVGDLDAVKKCLSRKANRNSQVKKSFSWMKKTWRETTMLNVQAESTPLHVAVTFHHKDIIKYLIESKVDVYAKDALDLTPIHLSSSESGWWSSTDSVQLFFKAIPDLRNFASKTGLSHLHVAAYANDEEAVEQMLLEGAEVDCVVNANAKQPPFLANFAGKTPLHVAIGRKSHKAVEVLLKHEANIHVKDLKGISALEYAINELEYTWVEPLIEMLKNGKYEVETSGMTLLHFACGMHDIEWAEELLKNGADVNRRINVKGNWDGATPLHMIFGMDYIDQTSDDSDQTLADIVKLVLANGADVTIECGELTLLHVLYRTIRVANDIERIISYEELEYVLRIADSMLDSQKSHNCNPVDYRGFSHFHFACVRNKVEVVNKFLDHGVDVNQLIDVFEEDIGGFTPLHFAMAHGSTEVAYLLLDRGGNVNAEDAYGNGPLHIAIQKKFVDLPLFEKILSLGANIHAKNLKGETLLHCLLKYGELTVEKLEFFLNRNCFNSIVNNHQDIFGSAMLSTAPNEFLPILNRLVQVVEVKTAIQSDGFDVIQSIVAIKHDGELTVDNYLNSLEFLIDMGCEIDRQNTEGKTALHKALLFCNVEATDALLQLGADVNLIDCATELPDWNRITEFRSMNLPDFDNIFACHYWKMKLIKLDVDESNLRHLEKFEKEDSFDNSLLEMSCQAELEKAKKTEIIKNLTARDFLSELGAVSRYPKLCPELRTIIDKFFKSTVDLRREFPMFSGLLAMQYRKAYVRSELMQPARDAIVVICQINLPIVCLELILDFFTNSDMKIAIAAVKELFD